VSRFFGALDHVHFTGIGLIPMPQSPAAVALGDVRGLVVRYARASFAGDAPTGPVAQLAARRWIAQHVFAWAVTRDKPVDIVVFATESGGFAPLASGDDTSLGALYDEQCWPDAFPGSGVTADGRSDPRHRAVTYVLAPWARAAFFCRLGAINAFEQPTAYHPGAYEPLAGLVELPRAHVSAAALAHIALQPNTLWSLGCAALEPIVRTAVYDILRHTPVADWMRGGAPDDTCAFPRHDLRDPSRVPFLALRVHGCAKRLDGSRALVIALEHIGMERIAHVQRAAGAQRDPVVEFHLGQIAYLVITALVRAYALLYAMCGSATRLHICICLAANDAQCSGTVGTIWRHLAHTRYFEPLADLVSTDLPDLQSRAAPCQFAFTVA
jgi:hypothetical protein